MLARAGGVTIDPETAIVRVTRNGHTGKVWLLDLYENPALDIALRDRTLTPRTYRVTYPDRPHNAEALLADPDSSRVWVVTKQAASGTIYELPRGADRDRPALRLHGGNRAAQHVHFEHLNRPDHGPDCAGRRSRRWHSRG